MVALNEMRCDRALLIKVLALIEPTISSISKESDLCDLAESLVTIRNYLSNEVQHSSNMTHTRNSDTVAFRLMQEQNTTIVANTTGTNETIQDGNTTEQINNSTLPDPVVSEYDTLRDACARMLSILGAYATERVSTLKVDSLCRLLAVYSLSPFQADTFVDACDSEVSHRQKLLESAASVASVEDLLQQAAKNAIEANSTVFGKNDDDSRMSLAALKKGLKSIFSPSTADNNNDNDKIAEEMKKFTEEVGILVDRVTAAVTRVEECMGQIGSASNVHTDTLLQGIQGGANFELGRCRELIDNYRRINFSTGRRLSRYDFDRDLGKRLLSRLIPRN